MQQFSGAFWFVFIAAFVRTSLGQSNGTECVVQGKRSKCKFDTTQLNLTMGTDLKLFDKNGKKIRCNKKAAKNGWYGDQCDGNARDANFIQRKNHRGVTKVFGSIHVGSDICQIQPNALGVEEMICTPESDFPPEADGLEPPAGDDADYDAHVRHLQVGFDPTVRIYNNVTNNAQHRQLYDDSGATIDVMVVWTKNAECVNSGLSKGCTLTATTETNMRGRIDLAVAETNTAYTESGILSSLRLVHAYRDSTYTESTNWDTVLSNLQSTSDGKLDSVHALRTLYGADMVQMIVSLEDYCGIANIDSTKAAVFSVVSWKCATGYYSYGHEIGHNFGMYHDRGTLGACSTTTGYNYGFRSPNAAFRSILSYDCKTGQCDKMPIAGCPRVQRFSNSQYLYNGQPIGNAANNNALQFNNLRATIAAHFPAMNCQSDNQCNDNNANTADTCNVAKAVCVFTPIAPRPPSKAPTKAPTNTPTRTPTVPTKSPTRTPTVPTKSPTKFPTKAPTNTPTRTPTVPTKAPTKSPTPSYFMESQVISGVSSAGWTVVSFLRTYTSPIPVCSIQYDTGTTLLPAVVRMQNVGTTSFEIRLQNPSNQVINTRPVHCVIVEEGKYAMPDGRKLEARKYSSTVTDHDKSWLGEKQSYLNSYTSPIVLGQVMSYADTRWSVFFTRASKNRSTAPHKTSLMTGKHLGEDSPTTRTNETVGYIVIEKGHATQEGIEFESGRTAKVVVGYVGTKVSHTFSKSFAATPVVTVVSQAGMKGSEGSWAVLTGAKTAATLGIAVDEDQTADTERTHPAEEVDYIVFSAAGAIQLTRLV